MWSETEAPASGRRAKEKRATPAIDTSHLREGRKEAMAVPRTTNLVAFWHTLLLQGGNCHRCRLGFRQCSADWRERSTCEEPVRACLMWSPIGMALDFERLAAELRWVKELQWKLGHLYCLGGRYGCGSFCHVTPASTVAAAPLVSQVSQFDANRAFSATIRAIL